MEHVKFSIIIPTFNSDSTLLQCINSVILQSFMDFEILILDGVSTDETLNIALRFNDERIKIISEPDNGIYDAMNKGIKLAQGEWLFFLGSDDELYDEFVLAKINIEIAQTNRKIIYGNVKIVGNAGWATDGQIYDGVFNLNKLLEYNICHQAIFYHSSVFKKNGLYNENYKICADYDFNIRCWANFHFHYIDLIISLFNGGGASNFLIDDNFHDDYWANLVLYYKWKLFNPLFRHHIIQISGENKNVYLKILICYHSIIQAILGLLRKYKAFSK